MIEKTTATDLANDGCADEIRKASSFEGVEIVVSPVAPVGEEEYEPAGFRCPHGVTYWVRPSAAQQARWEAEGLT